MSSKIYISLAVALAIFGSLALAIPAFAQNAGQPAVGNGMFGRGGMNRGGMPTVVGTVSAINGNSLTVSGKQGFNSTAATTIYTVDATNAKITKNNTTGTISSIVVGDTIAVQGTVNGTSVTATNIRDGLMVGRGKNGVGQGQAQIQGNGQPIVAGKITAISGNTMTITNNSNVTYSVDASSAKFSVTGITTPTISNVAVNDNIVVQGAVNGNYVVASFVIDHKAPANKNTGNANNPESQGFMGGIMNFFKHMFGF